MKNIDLQKNLDYKKYYKSEMAEKDLSGKMDYCEKCNYRKGAVCDVSQEQREENSYCAKAYRKLKREH